MIKKMWSIKNDRYSSSRKNPPNCFFIVKLVCKQIRWKNSLLWFAALKLDFDPVYCMDPDDAGWDNAVGWVHQGGSSWSALMSSFIFTRPVNPPAFPGILPYFTLLSRCPPVQMLFPQMSWIFKSSKKKKNTPPRNGATAPETRTLKVTTAEEGKGESRVCQQAKALV